MGSAASPRLLRVVIATLAAFIGSCHSQPDPVASQSVPDQFEMPPAPEDRPPTSAILIGPCPELERPDALELRQWLVEGRFVGVEAVLHALDAAYEENTACEKQLWYGYRGIVKESANILAPLDRWIEIYPDSVTPRILRSMALVNEGYAARGSGYSTDTPQANFDRMADFFARSLEDVSAANELAAPHLVTADAALRVGRGTGRAREGEALARAFLDRHPDSFIIWNKLVGSYQPKWGGSIADMERLAAEAQSHAQLNPSLRIMPGFPHAYLGKEASAAKDYVTAVKEYSKALEYGDHVTFWSVGRSAAFRRLGLYDHARADSAYAILGVPGNAEAWASAGLVDYGRADWPAAVVHFDRAIEIAPTHCEALTHRGAALEMMRNYLAAEADYRTVYDNECGHSFAAYRLGTVLHAYLERPGDAVAPLERAVRLRPTSQAYWLGLGVAQQNSDAAGAEESYRRSLALVELGDPQSEEYAAMARANLERLRNSPPPGSPDDAAPNEHLP